MNSLHLFLHIKHMITSVLCLWRWAILFHPIHYLSVLLISKREPVISPTLNLYQGCSSVRLHNSMNSLSRKHTVCFEFFVISNHNFSFLHNNNTLLSAAKSCQCPNEQTVCHQRNIVRRVMSIWYCSFYFLANPPK